MANGNNGNKFNKYIGARYVPLILGDWEGATRDYEPLTVVQYQGNSYTSKQYVPTGIPITDQRYWAATGNYNGQVDAYRQEVQGVKSELDGIKSDVDTIKSDIEKSTDFTKVYLNNKTELSTQISDAFSSIGDNLYFILIEDCVINAQIQISNRTYVLDGSGHSISSTTSALFTNIATLYSSYACTQGESTVNLSVNPADIQQGDYVKIIGDSASIVSQVTLKNANVLTLSNILPNMGTNITVQKIRKDNCIIRNVIFRDSQEQDTVRINGTNVIVENCIFENIQTFSINDGFHVVRNNQSRNCGNGVLAFRCSHSSIVQNKIEDFAQGIRCVNPSNLCIDGNVLSNGLNKQYSGGIDLIGEGSSRYVYDNKVINNKVINANTGIQGSAVGGIHLNFNARRNALIGNTSNFNGIGIYLENDCRYTTIVGNTCCSNGGWYGVGIELDFDCSHNVISNNVCNNNVGNIDAKESCGIEVRASSLVTNPCYNNQITSNTCNDNGLYGIYCSGDSTTVSNNVCSGNGSIGVDDFGEILVYHAVNPTIMNNCLRGQRGGGYAIFVIEPTDILTQRLTIRGNTFSGAYKNVVLISEGVGNVVFENNQGELTSTNRSVYFKGTDALNINTVIVRNNTFVSGGSGGFSLIEISYVFGFLDEGNVVNGAKYTCSTNNSQPLT